MIKRAMIALIARPPASHIPQPSYPAADAQAGLATDEQLAHRHPYDPAAHRGARQPLTG